MIPVLFYCASFVIIWLGAGLIIQSVDKIARRLKLSSFSMSFFILGLLTSIPETAISATAVADRNPEIFVGTFLGGTVVIFLFIIPLLAIVGKGIRISHDLKNDHILFTLLVLIAPALFALDQRITNFEGLILIVLYLVLFYIIQKRHGIFDHNNARIMELKTYSFFDILKVGLGVGLVFVSSQYIVKETISLSHSLHIPTYYISLILLSIGTNLPELSLAVRSVLSGKKDIAFGDYLGSAAANTLLFGIFTLINDGEVLTVNNFFIIFLFTCGGLGLFYFFSKSQRFITVREGFILLGVYLLFVGYEIGRALSG